MTEQTFILSDLLTDIDGILGRVKESYLRRYSLLQNELRETDVTANGDYQRLFRGYYKVRGREPEWNATFFRILENWKHDQYVTFPTILNLVFQETGRVEPSFCSKLVATIRPDKPVYDKLVRQNLQLCSHPERRPLKPPRN